MAIGALLGLASGLFGGGGAAAAPAGPVTTTVTQTAAPVTLGSKYLGRGSVSATETSASGSATLAAPAKDNTPIYVLAGAGILVAAFVLISKRGSG